MLFDEAKCVKTSVFAKNAPQFDAIFVNDKRLEHMTNTKVLDINISDVLNLTQTGGGSILHSPSPL